MEHGDGQGHGQGHSQGHGELQVQTGFDTFVMTGDMIIKTTPKMASPSVRPKTGKPSSSGDNMGDNPSTDVLLSQESSFNGGSEVPLRMEVAGYPRFPDVPMELDIPPDDISSEDERYRVDCSEDLDVTNLPPPPAEFFGGDFSDTSLTSGTVVCPVAGLPEGDGRSESWRNSLDEAIMRLESDTMSGETWISHKGPTQHGRAKLPGNLVSGEGARVRASRSQDNWCGGAGVGLVSIDVEGSSASVEALHPATTSMKSLDTNRFGETPLRHQSADDVRHRNIGNSELLSNPAAIVDSAEKQMQGNIASGYTVEPPPDYRDGAGDRSEASRQSPGQKLLGGGKNSPVRRPPPYRNGSEVSAESNHHIPTGWNNVSDNNVADASRTQLKDADHPSARRLAKRLYHLNGFRKSDVSKQLSKKYGYLLVFYICMYLLYYIILIRAAEIQTLR